MITAIAPRYDFLNSLLSIGQDRYWRKAATDILSPNINEYILDIATGTGDMILEIASKNNSAQIIGIDFSLCMLDIGRDKIKKKKYDPFVSLLMGSGECLPFANESFDCAVNAFGIRNFFNIKLGLLEVFRVLKPGGRIVILEFSTPNNILLKNIYNWYFQYVLPIVGKLISQHNNAYSYLPKSVAKFPDQNEFMKLMSKTGFQKVSLTKLSFGIVSIYLGYKFR